MKDEGRPALILHPSAFILCIVPHAGWNAQEAPGEVASLTSEIYYDYVGSAEGGISERLPMKLRLHALALLAVLVGPLVAVARAEISADEVRRAIHDGVTLLLRQQRVDGTWPDFRPYTGGETSLCVLALLNAGVDPDDEHMQRALRSLTSEPMKDLPSVYGRSLQTMVFCRADPARYSQQIRANYLWLQSKQITEGRRKGAWSYPGGDGDNSNSQFALLALYEAQRAFDALHAGVRIDPGVWRRARAYWKDCQNSDGSWGYYKGVAGTGSMTSRESARWSSPTTWSATRPPTSRTARSCAADKDARRTTRSSGESTGWDGTSPSRATPGTPTCSSGGFTTSTAWSASGG